VKNLCIALALALVAAIGILIGGVLLALRGGISAKVEPTGIEATIARRMKRLGIPSSYRQLHDPVPASPQTLAAGRAHFADHCAICHANDGSSQTEMGRNLYPRTPDLRLAQTQQLTDGELFYIVENGIRFTGMPGWGDGSEEDQRASWHLVSFIRHLPQLSQEEKLQMERMNPKSPEEWRQMQEDEEFLEGKESSREGHGQPRHH
jgi:mono/diheme cytochrome c family protein